MLSEDDVRRYRAYSRFKKKSPNFVGKTLKAKALSGKSFRRRTVKGPDGPIVIP